MTRLRHLVAGVRPRPHWLLALALAAAVVFVGQPARNTEAQATRTWVSGVGDDANPCSRTAPCKTFAGAISKTAGGGIINCIDDAGFGQLTITKSITIDCSPHLGGVLAAGGNGININTPSASDVVVLRGLDIEGNGTGSSGVSFNTQGTLFIENCVIYQFRGGTGEGVHVATTNNSKVFIKDSIIRNNSVGGVHVVKPGAGSSLIDMDNVRVEHNGNGTVGFGGKFESNVFGTVRNSTASDNVDAGWVAQVTVSGQSVSMKMTNSSATDHVALSSSAGVRSDGNGAVWVLDNNLITNNFNGMNPVNSGIIVSFGNNHNFGNVNNGAPTSTTPAQ